MDDNTSRRTSSDRRSSGHVSESDATNTEAENKDGDEEGAQDFIPCPHEFSLRNCFRTWKFSASSAKCVQGLAMKIKMDKQDNKKNCANMRSHNVSLFTSAPT